MGVVLIIAGNHSQYVQWVRTESRRSPLNGVPREIREESDLRGVSAEQIDGVVLAGGYTENRAWESDRYRHLMNEAAEMGLPWARSPAEDWEKATAEPVTSAQMSETRAELERLEQALEDDEVLDAEIIEEPGG